MVHFEETTVVMDIEGMKAAFVDTVEVVAFVEVSSLGIALDRLRVVAQLMVVPDELVEQLDGLVYSTLERQATILLVERKV